MLSIEIHTMYNENENEIYIKSVTEIYNKTINCWILCQKLNLLLKECIFEVKLLPTECIFNMSDHE